MTTPQTLDRPAAPAPPAPRSRRAGAARPTGWRRAAWGVLDVLGSFGLAVAVLLLLFVVVLLGTLAQGAHSLYDVQQTYFESPVFVVELFGGFPLPLPGGALLLGVLLVNLIVGGVLRMRFRWASAGILVTHLGIILLLVGSAIEYSRSDKGFLRLQEGQASDVFQSYTEWEIAIQESSGPKPREFVIPQKAYVGLVEGRERTFTSPDLPFDVRLSGYARNSEPRPAATGVGAEGYLLSELPPDPKEAENNVPGLHVALVPKAASSGPPVESLLWGFERFPLQASFGGRRYDVALRKQQWRIPYQVQLTRFVHREYAGTDMPSEFSSYVTQTEGGVQREAHITMNEPLRSRGYTFYQSAWGPQDPRVKGPLFSVFSVVRNPTDRVPLWACIVIALGMLIQFGLKLYRHLKSESKSRGAHAVGAEASA